MSTNSPNDVEEVASHDLFASGRDGTWGQGTFGSGQRAAYADICSGEKWLPPGDYMADDWRAGYTNEWNRLQKISEANAQEHLPEEAK